MHTQAQIDDEVERMLQLCEMEKEPMESQWPSRIVACLLLLAVAVPVGAIVAIAVIVLRQVAALQTIFN